MGKVLIFSLLTNVKETTFLNLKKISFFWGLDYMKDKAIFMCFMKSKSLNLSLCRSIQQTDLLIRRDWTNVGLSRVNEYYSTPQWYKIYFLSEHHVNCRWGCMHSHHYTAMQFGAECIHPHLTGCYDEYLSIFKPVTYHFSL